MIKKILYIVMSATSVMLAISVDAGVFSETVNGITWNFTVKNGGVSEVGSGSWDGLRAVPSSTTGAITTPNKLLYCPVVSVGDFAFDGCSGLTKISMPATVTQIGNKAFFSVVG